MALRLESWQPANAVKVNERRVHSLSELSVRGLAKEVISILIANEYLFFLNLLYWLSWVYYTAVYKNKSVKSWHIAGSIF